MDIIIHPDNIALLNEVHKYQYEKIRIKTQFDSPEPTHNTIDVDYQVPRLNVWQSQSANYRFGYQTVQRERQSKSSKKITLSKPLRPISTTQPQTDFIIKTSKSKKMKKSLYPRPTSNFVQQSTEYSMNTRHSVKKNPFMVSLTNDLYRSIESKSRYIDQTFSKIQNDLRGSIENKKTKSRMVTLKSKSPPAYTQVYYSHEDFLKTKKESFRRFFLKVKKNYQVENFEKDPQFQQYFKTKYENASIKQRRRNIRIHDLDFKDTQFFLQMLEQKKKVQEFNPLDTIDQSQDNIIRPTETYEQKIPDTGEDQTFQPYILPSNSPSEDEVNGSRMTSLGDVSVNHPESKSSWVQMPSKNGAYQSQNRYSGSVFDFKESSRQMVFDEESESIKEQKKQVVFDESVIQIQTPVEQEFQQPTDEQELQQPTVEQELQQPTVEQELQQPTVEQDLQIQEGYYTSQEIHLEQKFVSLKLDSSKQDVHQTSAEHFIEPSFLLEKELSKKSSSLQKSSRELLVEPPLLETSNQATSIQKSLTQQHSVQNFTQSESSDRDPVMRQHPFTEVEDNNYFSALETIVHKNQSVKESESLQKSVTGSNVYSKLSDAPSKDFFAPTEKQVHKTQSYLNSQCTLSSRSKFSTKFPKNVTQEMLIEDCDLSLQTHSLYIYTLGKESLKDDLSQDTSIREYDPYIKLDTPIPAGLKIVFILKQKINKMMAKMRTRKSAIRDDYISKVLELHNMRSEDSKRDDAFLVEGVEYQLVQKGFFLSQQNKEYQFSYQLHKTEKEQFCWSIFVKKGKISRSIWQYHKFQDEFIAGVQHMEDKNVGQAYAITLKHIAKMTLDMIFQQAQNLKTKIEKQQKFNLEQQQMWENWWIEAFRQQLHLEL